jgi:hypothetical protein
MYVYLLVILEGNKPVSIEMFMGGTHTTVLPNGSLWRPLLEQCNLLNLRWQEGDSKRRLMMFVF